MEAYAVVETGGKQYIVKAGDTLKIERLDAEAGKQMELSTVLALSDGKALKVGKPVLAGSKVVCTILSQERGPKVISFKKKRRKGYTRKKGHRQSVTVVRIDSIS